MPVTPGTTFDRWRVVRHLTLVEIDAIDVVRPWAIYEQPNAALVDIGDVATYRVLPGGESIVSVDSLGQVKALAFGQASVEASYGNKSSVVTIR